MKSDLRSPRSWIEKFRKEADSVAKQQARIQRKIDQKDQTRGKTKKNKKTDSPQTSKRKYPAPPFPKQHLVKPGREEALRPPPLYDAPHYKGSGKLDGKTALITGGDSGIGRSVAVLFAREGADVGVVYLNEHEDAAVTKEAVEKEGQKCILLSGDVGDFTFCQYAVAETVRSFGKMDILVNNAAFQEHTDSIENLEEEHFSRTLKTNLYGYFFMAKAAIPELKRGDCILMTGSVTGIYGSRHLLDYSMTKGGIHAFTRALAGQLSAKGIRVNAVAPGPVWTPLNPADKPSDQVAKFGSESPMKRPAQPEEIAPAFVFLAAPCCSSYITGEILPILGGYE